MALFEKIGKQIAKANMPAEREADEAEDSPEEEADESPGAMLVEALGIDNADIPAVDAALKAAIRKLG